MAKSQEELKENFKKRFVVLVEAFVEQGINIDNFIDAIDEAIKECAEAEVEANGN